VPRVEVNSVELYYEEHGSGEENFIFVHGGVYGSEIWEWSGFWDVFPEKFNAYAIDLRGHGKSVDVAEGWTYPQWTDDVYQISKKLNLGKFVFVGISMGTGVGYHLMVDYPEVLKGVVAIAPFPLERGIPLPLEDPKVQELVAKQWRNEPAIRASVDRRFPPAADKTLEEKRVRWRQELFDYHMNMSKEKHTFIPPRPLLQIETEEEMIDFLSKINMPALLLCGGKDRESVPAWGFRTAMAVNGAKLVLFKDEGHSVGMSEHPEQIVEEIELFVKQLNRRSTA